MKKEKQFQILGAYTLVQEEEIGIRQVYGKEYGKGTHKVVLSLED